MTCPCEEMSLAQLEALVSACQSQAAAMRAANAGLPAWCSIIPYHQNATETQKKCHASKTAFMFARWFACALDPNPSTCFEGACDDYADAVDSCYT